MGRIPFVPQGFQADADTSVSPHGVMELPSNVKVNGPIATPTNAREVSTLRISDACHVRVDVDGTPVLVLTSAGSSDSSVVVGTAVAAPDPDGPADLGPEELESADEFWVDAMLRQRPAVPAPELIRREVERQVTGRCRSASPLRP